MTDRELVRRRLASHRLVPPGLPGPRAVVRWLGAVQAQDYRAGLWAVALRTRGAGEAEVERAIAGRQIVRSWPMRGTLHLVAAEDLRWMLRLCAGRVIRRAAGRHRQLGLDARVAAAAGALLEREMAGGRQLTRGEMYQLMAGAGISPAGQRGIHLLGWLAMEGLICLAAHRGKQPTFALLDEWLPPAPDIAGDQALARLARRYFTGHGPASEADFAWWTGLTLGEARRAIAAAGRHLVARDRLIAAARAAGPAPAGPSAHLLPGWDEYTVAYKDRAAIADPAVGRAFRGGVLAPVVLLDGRVAGTWQRRSGRARVAVRAELVTAPSAAHRRALAAAARRYGEHLGLPVDLRLTARRGAAGARPRARRS